MADLNRNFTKAAAGHSADQGPVATYPINAKATQELLGNLKSLQSRTDESRLERETTPEGQTKYALIDMKNNQPLATLQVSGQQGTLALYKSPEDLAKRIDSFFVTPDTINAFLNEARAPGMKEPSPVAASSTPYSPPLHIQ